MLLQWPMFDPAQPAQQTRLNGPQLGRGPPLGTVLFVK